GMEGMPKIMLKLPSEQNHRKAVLSYMGTMEQIHQKSYSTIYTTLIDSSNEINNVFEWVKGNKHLQYKGRRIADYYRNITDDESLYMAMVASVYLASTLFYSGFFYTLYQKGLGKMVNTGEIITKIVMDEKVHSIFVSLLASEIHIKYDITNHDLVNQRTVDIMTTDI